MRDTNIDIILIEPGPITSKFRTNSNTQFIQWVDWKNAARADQYQSEFIPRLQDSVKVMPFELPASAVTAKLLKALNARNPKAHYYVTKPTYIMSILRRILPTRALDAILSRA